MTVSKHRRLSTLEHRLNSRTDKAQIAKECQELRWALALMNSDREKMNWENANPNAPPSPDPEAWHLYRPQERGETTLQWQARVLGFTVKEWRAKIKEHGASLEYALFVDRLHRIYHHTMTRKDNAEADMKPREAKRLNREYGFIRKLLVALGAIDLEMLRVKRNKDYVPPGEEIFPEGDETLEDWGARVLGFTRGQWDKERKKAAPEGLLSFGTELLALALFNPDDGVSVLAGDLEERRSR